MLQTIGVLQTIVRQRWVPPAVVAKRMGWTGQEMIDRYSAWMDTDAQQVALEALGRLTGS